MLNISRGIVARPQKVVIYGPEGIGKTTLASKMPDPLFIDTEGGSAHLDVRRIQKPENWDDLISVIKEVAATPDICKSLVLDTADWAEQMAIDHILKKYNQPSIEAFGYGKGYTYIGEEFARLLSALDSVIVSGKNVVVTAHAKMRKFEQPDEMGAYDRWEMKLTRQSAPLLKEWCDLLLFCNYEVYTVTDQNNVAKAQGGKRVMYTSHHPCWDAKNRHSLPDKLDMDFKYLALIFGTAPVKTASENSTPASETPYSKVEALLTEDGITEEELRKFVAGKGHYPEATPVSQYTEKFINAWVLKYWTQIKAAIKHPGESTGNNR